jgi:hypothetical protein
MVLPLIGERSNSVLPDWESASALKLMSRVLCVARLMVSGTNVTFGVLTVDVPMILDIIPARSIRRAMQPHQTYSLDPYRYQVKSQWSKPYLIIGLAWTATSSTGPENVDPSRIGSKLPVFIHFASSMWPIVMTISLHYLFHSSTDQLYHAPARSSLLRSPPVRHCLPMRLMTDSIKLSSLSSSKLIAAIADALDLDPDHIIVIIVTVMSILRLIRHKSSQVFMATRLLPTQDSIRVNTHTLPSLRATATHGVNNRLIHARNVTDAIAPLLVAQSLLPAGADIVLADDTRRKSADILDLALLHRLRGLTGLPVARHLPSTGTSAVAALVASPSHLYRLMLPSQTESYLATRRKDKSTIWTHQLIHRLLRQN